MSPHYHHHQTVVIFDRLRSYCFGHYISKLADAIKQLCTVKTYKKKLTTAFNMLHHLITEIKLIIAIIDHQNINGYRDDHNHHHPCKWSLCEGLVGKEREIFKEVARVAAFVQSSSLPPTSSSSDRNQHHHQIIAINIDKIMVIIDKNSGEAKTFHFHSMSVSSCALDVGFSIYAGFI